VLAAALALALPAWGLTQQEEIDLGKQAARKLREYGLREEPCLDRVGEGLKSVASRKDLPWHFWVIEFPGEYNAFALPGGFVFITRDYYDRLGDDALAFVIGHEMAHVEKKHYVQAQRRAKQAQVYSVLLGVLIGEGSGSARTWQTASDLGVTAYYTHYSRKLEKEADLVGFQLMQKAGYDARGAVEAMEKLREDNRELPHLLAQIYATHPVLSSREERLEALGKEAPPPVPRPVCKRPAPKLSPEEQAKLRAAREKRPPLALRLEGESGGRWENPWRKDLTALLRREVEASSHFRSSDRLVLYEPNISQPLAEAKARGASYLLTIGIRSFEEEKAGAPTEAGQPVKVSLEFGAELVELASAKVLWKGEAARRESGLDFLPSERERLWPDTTASRLAQEALATLLARAEARLPPPETAAP
jgi:predicted Zn-dependent protease